MQRLMAAIAVICCISHASAFIPSHGPLLRVSKGMSKLDSYRCHREVPVLRKSCALRMGFFDSIIKSVGLPVQKEGFQPVSDVDNAKTVEQYLKRVEEQITPLEAKIEKLSDDELKAKTAEFRNRLQVGFNFLSITVNIIFDAPMYS
jgi:hypothetical protein